MRPAQIQNLLSEERAKSAQAEMDRFFADLDEESDRGMVLSAAAYFDKVLSDCVSCYLKPSKQTDELLSSTREIGTFSGRNKLCFALRIFNETEYRALRLLGQIRNDFAHKVLVSLDDPSISDKILEFGKTVLAENERVWPGLKVGPKREVFSFTTFCLNDRIWLRPYDIGLHVEEYPDIIPFHSDSYIGSSQ